MPRKMTKVTTKKAPHGPGSGQLINKIKARIIHYLRRDIGFDDVWLVEQILSQMEKMLPEYPANNVRKWTMEVLKETLGPPDPSKCIAEVMEPEYFLALSEWGVETATELPISQWEDYELHVAPSAAIGGHGRQKAGFVRTKTDSYGVAGLIAEEAHKRLSSGAGCMRSHAGVSRKANAHGVQYDKVTLLGAEFDSIEEAATMDREKFVSRILIANGMVS